MALHSCVVEASLTAGACKRVATSRHCQRRLASSVTGQPTAKVCFRISKGLPPLRRGNRTPPIDSSSPSISCFTQLTFHCGGSHYGCVSQDVFYAAPTRGRRASCHSSRSTCIRASKASASAELQTESESRSKPESSKLKEVVIVGGGIAGLSTALALHRVGIKSLVLESAPGPRDSGAAIALWRNAWRALDVLGVGEKLRHDYILLDR